MKLHRERTYDPYRGTRKATEKTLRPNGETNENRELNMDPTEKLQKEILTKQ